MRVAENFPRNDAGKIRENGLQVLVCKREKKKSMTLLMSSLSKW